MALTIKIRGDATQLEKTLEKVKTKVGGLGSSLAKFAAGGAGFAAALAGINGLEAGVTKLAGFFKDASMKAAGVEALTMQFETLLGSVDKAKARMQELRKFAATTPFEVSEISQTSKLLQTLGGDMLATGEGLRMVGDAAAIAGQPLEEVGLHIGRIFNALTSGTSAGESINRMQELGLMTGRAKIEFENLAKAQKKNTSEILSGDQALKLLKETFRATDGAMERLAATTEGKLSNLTDNFDNLKVALGTGINDGLRVALDATNTAIPQMEDRFRSFGNNIGKVIADAVDGNFDILVAAGVLAGEAFVAGFRDVFGNMLVSAMRSGTEGFLNALPGDTAADKQASKNISETIFGPGVSLSDRAMDLKTQLAPAVQNLQDTITKRDIERQTEIMNKVLQAIEALPGKGVFGVNKDQMKGFIMYSR